MKVSAYNNGNKERILDLGKNYEIELPEDYKQFLIEYNGATIDDAFLYVKDLDEYMSMEVLFGIGVNKNFSDILKINDEYRDDIPGNSLLIGCDAGSGFLLLVCDDEDSGIWYYDHTYFFNKSSDELNTYFICETFTEFMQMLENTTLPKEE